MTSRRTKQPIPSSDAIADPFARIAEILEEPAATARAVEAEVIEIEVDYASEVMRINGR